MSAELALSEYERELMEHATAWRNKRNRLFRNYFAAGPEGRDRETWDALLARGLAMASPHAGSDRLTFFHVTPEGLKALEAKP